MTPLLYSCRPRKTSPLRHNRASLTYCLRSHH